MTFGPQTGFLEPDNHLYGQYYPGELKNQSHINQRHMATQQYYVQMPSAVYVAVWEGALENYAPSFGYDVRAAAGPCDNPGR
jgi:hypothetical protein